ncbi:asparaginase [Micropruina sonneratiae]|uniref:asparaginase n=1 Tax=Micropruina sonneratiae TaxID=2986940 RepID=UPI002226419F|nr:asparaginase [Micropruina sp. KQZ13P-5]MCW3156917.1 asparaginase [Micropruina sp. KQZ13P-5]
MVNVGDPPVVAQVVRNGFVESSHRGIVVVTRADGSVSYSRGDYQSNILPRSSLKPIQALAMVRCGLQVPSDQLAVACASHSGEPMHLQTVLDLLHGAGLDESALRNTPDLPLMDAQRNEWIAERRGPSSLAQNCSGKHAAMLATCVVNDWPLETYLNRGHPTQQAVIETIRGFGMRVAWTSIDGCGAPALGVSLVGLARMYGMLAAATEGAEKEVADAMRAHPELVGGTGRDVTDLMRGIPGMIAKDGAEGVYAAGLPDGRGIALKIADGGIRARPVVMGAVLRRLWLGDAPLRTRMMDMPIYGRGQVVGAVIPIDI